MRKKHFLLLSAAAIMGAALGTVAFGPSALGQAAGSFTAAQVDAGRQAFADNCAVCHLADLAGTNDAPALAGSPFIGAWKGRTTAQLYSKIHTTMPLGRGGSLDEATYANIVAYILRANGATPGSTAFTPTTAPVAIGAIANGQMPAGLNAARVAQTTGAAESRPANGQAALPPRRPDPGRFSLPTKFGLTLKGNIQNYVPVTDEMLRNPPDGDWLMFRRNYQGWSYSPLNQINTQNASSLTLKWMWSMPENGTMEITPMVHNGIIYVWGTGNTIQALNASNGELLWENRLGPAPRAPGPGPSTEETRALGLWGNNLYVNTPYGMVYALDARTGEEIWKNNIVDYKPGIGGSTGGVIIINGKVLVGMTNCGRPKTDDHCYISAYDAKTGKRDWKFVTVALKGDPGGDSWGDLPDNMRKGSETWIAGTYDPELNTTYWGTAQAKPWRRDLRGSGKGDTNYANSTVALDPDTGKLKWFYQHAPGESLDLDEVYERVLINHGDQKTLMTIGKAGILWKLDRVTGKFIDAKETVFQNIWTSIDKKTGRPNYRKDIVDQKVDQWLSSCPGPEGGHDWQATSYHQPSDTLIIPLSQSCVFMLGNGSQTYFEMPGTDGNMGRLSAYRTADMKPLWSFQQRAPFLTGVVSTAGNLAFVGDFDRVFRAVDTSTGKTLWKTRLGTTVQGFPVSFSVDGKQYIAVTTGLGGGSPQAKPGTMLTEVHRPPNGYNLFVFGLPDDK
jgi:alcohol dehydrogenase (cytochrome c)